MGRKPGRGWDRSQGERKGWGRGHRDGKEEVSLPCPQVGPLQLSPCPALGLYCRARQWVPRPWTTQPRVMDQITGRMEWGD